MKWIPGLLFLSLAAFGDVTPQEISTSAGRWNLELRPCPAIAVAGTLGSELDGAYRVAGALPVGSRWRVNTSPPALVDVASYRALVTCRERIFSSGFEVEGGELPLAEWSAVRGLGGGDVAINPLQPQLVLHLTNGTDDYLFSRHGRTASAAGDTPASTRIRPGLEMSEAFAFQAYEIERDPKTRATFWNLGGVSLHPRGKISFSIRNAINSTTKIGALDDLLTVAFDGQEAIVWACYAENTANGWRLPDLSDATRCAILSRGTVDEAGFQSEARDVFAGSFIEQTAAGLQVPVTPQRMRGLARGVAVENGGSPTTGARIVRPAETSSTASQSFAWTFTHDGNDSGAAEHIIFVHPIVRVRRAPGSPDTLNVAVRNAAGSYAAVPAGGFDFPAADTLISVALVYDSATTTAETFLDGVSQGTRTITGGLYAATSGTTSFYQNPSVGTLKVTWYAYRHSLDLMADEDVERFSMYGLPAADGLDFNVALEFNEGVGTRIADHAGQSPATLEGFSDADGAWTYSGTGEPASSLRRLPPVIGRPFAARGEILDAVFQVYTPGYVGEAREERAVYQDKARLPPEFSDDQTDVDFAADDSIAFDYFGKELALGQVISNSAGSNAGDLTIASRSAAFTPERGMEVTGSTPKDIWFVEESVVVETGVTTTLASDQTRWDDVTVLQAGMPAYRVTDQVSRDVASSGGETLAGVGSFDSDSVGKVFIENFGPEASATEADEAGANNSRDIGWRGEDGSMTALSVAPEIMRSSYSSDFAPSVVYRARNGDWHVRGFLKTPSSAVFSWGAADIFRAQEMAIRTRYQSVELRHSFNWSYSPGDASAGPSAAGADRLASALSREYSIVSAGDGEPRLPISFYGLGTRAQFVADSLLDIVTNGHPYKLILNAPRTLSEITTVVPFDVVEVTYSPDSYLAARKGCIVGYKLLPNGRAEVIVYFVGS